MDEHKRHQSVRDRFSKKINANAIDIDMEMRDEQNECDSEDDHDAMDSNIRSRAELQEMEVAQLKALCKARGLCRSGVLRNI